MQSVIEREIANQFAGKSCWLDGKEAKVGGRLNRFATVATLDGKQSLEYSWHVVNRVMRANREFRS